MKAQTNKRPGCLASILALFKSPGVSKQEPLPYRLRDDFLSPAEFSFYKVLTTKLGSRVTVLSKVRLADLFFIAEPNQNFSYFNRIAQRHIDFVLCLPDTMKPILGIELDDSSHERSSSRSRDEFVDEVFLSARLPLVRFKALREYNSTEIVAKIDQILIDNSSRPPATVNKSEAASIPLCPKCGIPMVVRTASQGDHKGKKFYGCSNFPRCREVLQIV